MKIDYDTVADAMYFTLNKGKVSKSVKLEDKLVVDLSAKGDIIGMEILNASSKQGQELERSIKKGVPVSINSGVPVLA